MYLNNSTVKILNPWSKQTPICSDAAPNTSIELFMFK